MRQIGLVIGFTFRDAVKKKSFIISSAILAVIVVLLCLAPRLIGALSKEEEKAAPEIAVEAADDRPYRCYVIDENGLLPGAIDALTAEIGNFAFVPGEPSKAAEYRAEIAVDSDVSLIIVREMGDKPYLYITTKDFMTGISGSAVSRALSRQYVRNELAEFGFSEEALRVAQTELSYQADTAGTMNVSGYAMGIVLTMLIFFAVYFYGYGVAMSVANEKTSRVMETLIVSAKPSRILLGKCIAMGAVGLLQFGSLLALAVICFRLLVPDGQVLFGMLLSFEAFTLRSALLMIVYFILGYALYAVMNAACGATVSKIEDLNSAMMPVMFVALGAFYLGYMTTIMGGGGMLDKIAMYLPFSAPFSVPFKLLNGGVTDTDLVISIALLVVATVLISLLSMRLYSASVLHYGKKPKLRELYAGKRK